MDFGAKNGTRTRDPDLGKVVLYQLSYFRICVGFFVVCVAKVRTIFELASVLELFLQKKFHLCPLFADNQRLTQFYFLCKFLTEPLLHAQEWMQTECRLHESGQQEVILYALPCMTDPFQYTGTANPRVPCASG